MSLSQERAMRLSMSSKFSKYNIMKLKHKSNIKIKGKHL